MLARLRRLDPKLLQPVDVLERNLGDLAVVRVRDRLVQARSKLVSCVRAVVKTTGQRMPKCDADTFHRWRSEIPEPLRVALMPVMNSIEALTEQVQALERVAKQLCDTKYPETERLQQVRGVGPITALAFVLTLGRSERFPSSRRVGSYLGLRPKRDASGESDPSLGITKSGDRFVRRLLVGAAQYILGPFGKDSALRDWGLNLLARGGKAARKRAAVALARKLAVVMHRLWVTGEDYRPYPEGEPGPLKMVKVSA
jgi:transposase